MGDFLCEKPKSAKGSFKESHTLLEKTLKICKKT